MSAEKTGFKQEIRRGITLVVGQEAVVNLTLEVGNVEQQVTVTAEASLVNTTLRSTSELVSEKEVKDLPLNGRSFDQLLTLNVATTNFTSNIAHTGNVFSVAGRRPEENRVLINGIDYVRAASASRAQRPLQRANTDCSYRNLGGNSLERFDKKQLRRYFFTRLSRLGPRLPLNR